MSNPKQIIVLRKDLNMRKGKMVAQGAHASMAVFFNAMHFNSHSDFGMFGNQVTNAMKEWIEGSFTKICVSVNSEQELLDLHALAESKGIVCALIKDAGHTEFGGVPTYTALAIGPEYPEILDPVTSHLPLL